jgi:hypothetical protein
MSQKIFIIVTAVKTSQKAAIFGSTWYPSMERRINNDSTVTQLWSHSNLKMAAICLSETSAHIARATRCNTPEDSHNCYLCENIQEDSVFQPYICRFCSEGVGLYFSLLTQEFLLHHNESERQVRSEPRMHVEHHRLLVGSVLVKGRCDSKHSFVYLFICLFICLIFNLT